MADSKSWREIRGKLALNEARVDTYRRLLDAELQIAEPLLRRGLVTEAQVDAAISASQADPSGSDEAQPRGGEEEQIYLSALARYVSVLGGHLLAAESRLELQAVFPDETVTVMRTDAADRADSATPAANDDPAAGDQISGSEAS